MDACHLKQQAADLSGLLADHRRLLDDNVIHFITRNLWQSNVPETWRAPLLALTPAELLLLPTSLPIQAEWPESLSGFLEAARTLSIPALPSEAPAEVAAPDNTLALQSGVKGKKVHEIESLAPIIAQTAERVGARTILDLGAGVGHLAQVTSIA